MNEITIRKAEKGDVDAIVALLADDALGAKREDYRQPLPACYFDAFTAIDSDPNHELVVAERDGKIVGTIQLSFLPYLTYRGGWRAQIEAVRVSSQLRGSGLGGQLIEWAVARSRERGCHLVQLTSDKSREQAIHFYEKLGFVATHEGMKLWLSGARTG